MVDMTDAIPLMEADGTTGRNNARDIRTAWIARLFGADSTLDTARPGILARRWFSGHYYDLKVVQQTVADQSVIIYPGTGLALRSGQGPYIVHQDTMITNYALDAADPTNPRYDRIYARLYDHAIGDSSGGPHGPKIETVTGTPSGTPVVPALPTTDCLPICRILRPAATNAATTANITDERKGTSLAWTPRVLLPGDLTADPGLMVGERRIRLFTAANIGAGGYKFLEEMWTDDGVWTATHIPGTATTKTHAPLNSGTVAGAYTSSRTGATAPVGVSFVGPPSGTVDISWACGILPASAGSLGLCSFRIGTGSTLAGGTEIQGPSDNRAIQHGGASTAFEIQNGRTSTRTGLTPGTVYNAVMMFRATAAGATFGRVEISVSPQP